MGLAIKNETFSESDYLNFSQRLYQSLEVLKLQLQDPSFGKAPHKIGAELENYIVDMNGNALSINQDIIQASKTQNFTVELNKFNLEINFDPLDLDANAFSSLQAQMEYYLGKLRRSAANFDARIIPIGILPTLQNRDLSSDSMTDIARYRALSNQLYKMRGEHFKVNIHGDDELFLTCDHVALEGANTSFQFHLMCELDEFANVFNAVQLTTPLVIAVAANSPMLLQKKLWDETRIALFKQSIDSRLRNTVEWRQPSRVSFGHGWVRDGPWELFAESVALYPPIFAILSEENPLGVFNQGGTPKHEELALHMGTTWPWNRPVYCPSDGGHVRIEMRSLPAGPTNRDMVANVAFATGLAMGLKDSIRDFLAVMPFRFAEYNFYRAAQKGLDAQIVWTDPKKHQAKEMSIIEVLWAMLPVAKRGLELLGIAEDESDYYLSIIAKRLENQVTGARWQKQIFENLCSKHSKEDACRLMFERYIEFQLSDLPVSEWAINY
ncbi:glutamate--cysteine ligase [Pleionea sediminis]|uniref:glutamate--cysteine ligase n=1 Tax=Pleionea sediminis TaxID=2569479 RepID=UPI0011856925|nr:glutamate--cysteine ligase [Pleionea sediminis]